MYNILLSLFLIIFLSTKSFADVDFTTYSLGMSFNQIQEKLISDKFIFTKFNEDEFIARKLLINPEKNSGKELIDLVPSTEIKGFFCDNKLYKMQVSSYYMAGTNNLLMGRKNIYSYINSNNAVLDKINISQNKEAPDVGLVFLIDRSANGGSVKGEERVTTLLTYEIGSDVLKMRYQFENKWFCPE